MYSLGRIPYADADSANNPDRRSRLRYAFEVLGDAFVSPFRKKKKTVSPPSPEAEFIALATAVAKTTIERNVNGKETSSYNL